MKLNHKWKENQFVGKTIYQSPEMRDTGKRLLEIAQIQKRIANIPPQKRNLQSTNTGIIKKNNHKDGRQNDAVEGDTPNTNIIIRIIRIIRIMRFGYSFSGTSLI